MKVDYDSEGHSLLFEFVEIREYGSGDYVEELAGGSCIVWIHDGRPDSIQLLDADKDIAPLDEAAERFGLAAVEFRAAAQATITAPDREITIEIGQERLLGAEAEAA
jgi:hypothetical protein